MRFTNTMLVLSATQQRQKSVDRMFSSELHIIASESNIGSRDTQLGFPYSGQNVATGDSFCEVMSTLSIRRSRLERQMALRSTEEIPDGFAVRQGHLAPPLVTPDSPRPQKSEKTTELSTTHSLTIPSLQPRQKDGSSTVVRVESITLETDKKPRKK